MRDEDGKKKRDEWIGIYIDFYTTLTGVEHAILPW
jgi:hypothetical protein